MSTYPSNIPTFVTFTDEVDVVAANDENTTRNEIIALCTYIGTNPQGSRGSFVDRMNVCIGSYGGIISSNAFPADTTPRKLFYRDDAETLYIRRADNTAWAAVGNAPSNGLFNYDGIVDVAGEVSAGILNGTTTGAQYRYLAGVGGSCWSTKLSKISGVTTLTVYAKLWYGSGSDNHATALAFVIGGILTGSTITSTVNSTTPTWYSSVTDISSLVNGSFYDIGFTVAATPGGASIGYCGNIRGFGS